MLWRGRLWSWSRDIKELDADDKRLSGEIEKNVGSAKDV
jgi:hypothetical protein